MKDGFTENVYQAIGEKKEYPEWALGLAALLAMSSLFPIMVGLAIHLINICSLSSKQIPPTTNKLSRVDTSASTRPMMEENMEVFFADYNQGTLFSRFPANRGLVSHISREIY